MCIYMYTYTCTYKYKFMYIYICIYTCVDFQTIHAHHESCQEKNIRSQKKVVNILDLIYNEYSSIVTRVCVCKSESC